MPQLPAQRFPRRVELAPLAANAARPRVTPKRVNHGTADSTFREGLEFDSPVLVKAVRGDYQAEHTVLDEVTDVDRVGHRARHPAGQGFDERQAADDAAVLTGGHRLNAHSESPWPSRFRRLRAIAMRVPTAESVCSIAALFSVINQQTVCL